ncbi:MAG TPA: hypothetical protein VGX92_01480 [Pyrinomonadaceae bacterium]|jgi:hypothetical protein|nr:hypothetical protein [Pyrinomonadaceae bacterium]
MGSIYRILGGAALLAVLIASGALAQRPRSVNDPSPAAPAARAASVPGPQSVKAKYEGGVFGYDKKIDGTLSFDDTNNRLLFRNNRQKEVLFIPYAAVLSAFADTKSKRPIAADVASRVSIFGLPAMFIKRKFRYLTMQYRDPDTNAQGVTSFKMENKETLEAFLAALVDKAGLTSRGEVYVRRKDPNQP